jgi:hypothetical protein
MKKYLFLLLVVTLAFSGCEKDDICDDSNITTPRLVVSLYDNFVYTNSGIDTQRNIIQIRAIATGVTDSITWNNNTYLTNTNSFTLPLNTSTSSTEIALMKYNTSDYKGYPTPESISNIMINYTGKDVYVSRACGYKKNFELNGIPTFNSAEWIKNIVVSNSIIENEKVTHLKIYF